MGSKKANKIATTTPAAAPLAVAPDAPAAPATVADVLAPAAAPAPDGTAPADGAVAADDVDPKVPTIARQTERLQRIAGILGNLSEFASKVPDVASAAWGGELRTILAQADSIIGDALTTIAKAPADYSHPRTNGRANIGKGDAVQISNTFQEDFKLLLADVEFGTTAIGIVQEVDEKGRAMVHWDGGKVRALITTRRLSHAGKLAPAAAPVAEAAPGAPALSQLLGDVP